MNCNYIIKLANGKDLVIPANFSLLEESDTLVDLFENLDSRGVSSLEQEITKQINGILPPEVITEFIKENASDLGSIIDAINNQIESQTEFDTFQQALSSYLEQNSSKIDEIQADIDTPVALQYFKGASEFGLIGSYSIQEEHLKIKGRLQNSTYHGFNTSLYSSLDTFLNYVKTKDPSTYQSKVLLANKNEYSNLSLNIDNFTLYDKGDHTSLFLGLFKRVGLSMSKGSLASTFGDPEFFTGSISDTGEVNHSPFEQLLISNKPESKKLINLAIKEVADFLSSSKNSRLEDVIHELFVYLKPDIYVEESIQNRLKSQETTDKEYTFESTFRSQEDFTQILTNLENVYEEYGPVKMVNYDLYNQLKRDINIREDVIQLPLREKYRPYVLVTHLFPTSNGVRIIGNVIDKNGKIAKREMDVKNGTNIFYRKKTAPKQPFLEGKIYKASTDTLSVSSQYRLKTELLEDIMRVGDAIKVTESKGNALEEDNVDSEIVVGVYPNYVLTAKAGLLAENKALVEGDLTKTLIKDIIGIRSAQLKVLVDTETDLTNKTIKNLNKYNSIKDMTLISKGDIISDPTTGPEAVKTNPKAPKKPILKIVVATDKANVYVYTQNSRVDFLQRISRVSIKDARSYTHNQVTLDDVNSIASEFNARESRSASMSSFTDPYKAKDGDFFIYSKSVDGSDKVVFGKVTDSEVGKAVEWYDDINDPRQKVVNYLDVTGLKFYTKRKISSSHAMSTIRANGWDINFLADNDVSPLHEELRYIVPEGTDVTKLFILPNGYANIGQYMDATHVKKHGKKLGIDATQTIRDLLEGSGTNLDKKKIYAKKVSPNDNLYERNTTGISRMFGYELLPVEVKKELKALHKGVYFSVYSGSNIDNNIYRVEEVAGNAVVAHYSKINSEGKLLTFEKTFNLETLLQTKQGEELAPDGSIAKLFIQHGNSNFELIIDAIKQNLTVDKIKERKELTQLMRSMEEQFKDLGIKVEVWKSDNKSTSPIAEQRQRDFTAGQKAKIESDSDGNTTIILNDINGSYSDLVHENLHIFLTMLRIGSLEQYNKLTDAIINADPKPDKNGNLPWIALDSDQKAALLASNIYDKEEFVVNRIVDVNNNMNTFLASDLKNFMVTLAKVVKTHINKDYVVDENSLGSNPIEFLNTPMRTFYDVNVTSDNAHYNLSLIAFEPYFRTWMKDNNVTINCV